MKMLLALSLVAVIGGTFAYTPCSAPFELTFRADRHDWSDSYYRRYYVEYDRPNLRVVFFEEDFEGGSRSIRKILMLYYEQTGYEYDFKTKKCKRFNTGPFRPFEVPYNSTFEGEYKIGGPGETVTVNNWSDRIPTRRENWMGEFSLINCYPVTTFLVDQTNFNKTSITHHFDVVQGIVNPNDFELPSECQRNPIDLKEIPMSARKARSIHSGSMYD